MKRAHLVKLAIVVTGIGIGCEATSDVERLPSGSTTGTAPNYGYDASGGVPFNQGAAGDAAVGGGGGIAPKGPPPNYGTTITLANSPPPISGGTLIALADGTHLVASDSDRDQVYVVDLSNNAVATVSLSPHDEPGRVVEDDLGQVHVVLRSGGAIATINVASFSLVGRRNVCVSPRGIAYDSANARLVVACETGEVIVMPPAITGAPSTFATLDSGLRDVVIVGSGTNAGIYVSRFRTAEVMQISSAGALVATVRPSSLPTLKQTADATLAWRMIPALDASQAPIVVHQFSTLASVSTQPGGYSAPTPPAPASAPVSISCSPDQIVTPAISQVGTPLTTGPSTLVLPVDIAATPNGFAVISAGNGHTAQLPQMFVLNAGACGANASQYLIAGQPIAVAQLADGSLMVQSREPATLTHFIANPNTSLKNTQLWTPYVKDAFIISLSSFSAEDTGHAIFHSNSGAGLACASCHGEGADDSHVWTFTQIGQRRTPSLRGTISGTAPYHWDGTMTDISMLADQVMTGRMNGPQLTVDQKTALQSWLFAIPAPAQMTTLDPSLVAQGKALFESASVGCIGCHSGPRFTNNATVNVGTGGSFQVPPLIGVRARAPYLHSGCAATLKDRFGACATSQHGNITQLQPSDIDALVAYLESI